MCNYAIYFSNTPCMYFNMFKSIQIVKSATAHFCQTASYFCLLQKQILVLSILFLSHLISVRLLAYVSTQNVRVAVSRF